MCSQALSTVRAIAGTSVCGGSKSSTSAWVFGLIRALTELLAGVLTITRRRGLMGVACEMLSASVAVGIKVAVMGSLCALAVALVMWMLLNSLVRVIGA